MMKKEVLLWIIGVLLTYLVLMLLLLRQRNLKDRLKKEMATPDGFSPPEE